MPPKNSVTSAERLKKYTSMNMKRIVDVVPDFEVQGQPCLGMLGHCIWAARRQRHLLSDLVIDDGWKCLNITQRKNLVKCLAQYSHFTDYVGAVVEVDDATLHDAAMLALVTEWVEERCGTVESLPLDYEGTPLWRIYASSYLRGSPTIRRAICLTCQADVHLLSIGKGDVNVGVSTTDPRAYGAIAVGVVEPTYYRFWGVERAPGEWRYQRRPNIATADDTYVDASATLSVAAVVVDAAEHLETPNAVFYTADDGVWLFIERAIGSCEVFATWPADCLRE